MLRLEAVQDCLEDGVRVVGEGPPGGAHGVDGEVPRVLQNGADVPHGLVRCVVSAVSFVFLVCGGYAVGVPFLEPVAAGGEVRTEVNVLVSCLRCAGAQQGGKFCFRGPDVMEELLEGEVRWCFRVTGVALFSVGASGERSTECRALLYLCPAPWFSSAGNGSVGGRVSCGTVAAGGGTLAMMRSM